MPRNISFALTTAQICNRSKTVTRRKGWKFLKRGDILNACVKCMGLRPGESIERLCQIRVVDVRREPLDYMETAVDSLGPQGIRETMHMFGGRLYPDDYGYVEAAKEGFPEMTGSEFVKMFCEHMRCDPSQVVTRIEFEYLKVEV